MILTVEELNGKALDWMYERLLAGNYQYMKVAEGEILIHLNDDANPPGWYRYKSSINDDEDVHAVKEMINHYLGEGPFVVPTDLCSPKYAHKQHEKVESWFGPKKRWNELRSSKV